MKIDKMTITLEMDNSAFGEDHKQFEVARILVDLATKIMKRGYPHKLMDVNGNTCGMVIYGDEE